MRTLSSTLSARSALRLWLWCALWLWACVAVPARGQIAPADEQTAPADDMAVPASWLALLPAGEMEWKNVEVGGRRTTVFAMTVDSRGLVWLGTNHGLYFYDGVTTHSAGGETLCAEQVYAIVEHEGQLFLGCNNGLMVFDYASGTAQPYATAGPKEIRCLLPTAEGLWVGGLDGAWLAAWSEGRYVARSGGLPHRSVYALLRDARGIVYAGTYDGLARWNEGRQAWAAVAMPEAASQGGTCFVNCLLEAADGESIYVGCERALFRYRPGGEAWRRIAAVTPGVVKSLAAGTDGQVWVGTDNGVFALQGDTVRHFRHDTRQVQSLADNEVWCIGVDAAANVWAGHERGLSIASSSEALRRVKLSRLTHSGEGNEIHALLREQGGPLWLAGTNGAIRLEAGGAPRWYRHTDEAGALSHNRVRALQQDAEGRVWLATDAGLNRFVAERDGFVTYHITAPSGQQPARWVYAVVEDGDALWTGSFLGGLHRVGKARLGADGGAVRADRALHAAGSTWLANDLVNNVVRDGRGNLWILLFRDAHVACYSPRSGRAVRYDVRALTGAYPTHLCLDGEGRVWCAFTGGAVVFAPDGGHTVVRLPATHSDEAVLAMGSVEGGVWMSTQSNVWSIGGQPLRATLLPIPQGGYTAVYEDAATGRVLLGGMDEVVEVASRGIMEAARQDTIRLLLASTDDAPLSLAQLRPGEEGLTVPHGASLRLVASTLSYSPQTVQRYMYKLAATPADTAGGWVVMPEGVNTIALSGLQMGRYTLLVKTVGGTAAAVAVPLRVKPPVALSAWAIALYVLVAVGLVAAFVLYLLRRHRRALREGERRRALADAENKLTFLTSIAHDLKTPLSMIIGPVSLLRRRVHDAESRRSLDAVYDNAVRLNNMIHRTLELQHIDATADESLVIRSTFDVVAFCREAFEAFRESHPQKHFVFHTSCPQLLIEADAVKFESVVANLLSNACKYSDDGATVTLGIRRAEGEAEIVVADDGVGIAEGDQPLVFQRMYRAPSQAKLREGTGLGLYLIKKYLELMGGRIDLYSREGQGTSFVVTLPLAEEQAPAAGPAEASAESGRAKVLIVEDNGQVAGFLSELLGQSYTCLTAADGRAGLALASSFAPDLIIADEVMPHMTGLEMVRRLKQQPRLAATPIILLSAQGDPAVEAEGLRLGVDAYMDKPFEPQTLLRRVEWLLEGRSRLREQVRIQALTEAAEQPIEAETANEKALARIAQVIEENIANPDLNVAELCEKTGLQSKQLYRLVKKYMDAAPLDYIRRIRLQKAAVLLAQRRFTVAEVSYMVGFKTPSYFARCFQKQYGVKPSQYVSDEQKPATH